MKKNTTINANVEIFLTREDDYIVATCPALKISSYGKSEKEAKKNFNEAMNIFFEETNRKGTLEKVLVKYGWTISKKSYEPPQYTTKEMLSLFGNMSSKNVITEKIPMLVPA